MIISEKYVVEELEITERELGGDIPGVHLRYNQTEPHTIEDGVNVIAVIEISEEKYRLDYWGYAYGRLLVQRKGVEELGQEYLDTDEIVPSWTIDPETVNADDLPWWVPESVELKPEVQCQECQQKISARNAVTPSVRGTEKSPVLCSECWQNLH